MYVCEMLSYNLYFRNSFKLLYVMWSTLYSNLMSKICLVQTTGAEMASVA